MKPAVVKQVRWASTPASWAAAYEPWTLRPSSHYSGFEADANVFLAAEVNFSQLQANEPSEQGAFAFDRLAADFADGTFLGVSTIGGPIGRSILVPVLPASAMEMLFWG